MSNHEHRFSVLSATGIHIGLFQKERLAREVRAGHPGSTIEELVTFHHALAMVAAAYALAQNEAQKVADALQKTHDDYRHIVAIGIRDSIRTLTAKPAQAALDALLKAEREKVPREVVDPLAGDKCNTLKCQSANEAGVVWVTILAQIEKGSDHA